MLVKVLKKVIVSTLNDIPSKIIITDSASHYFYFLHKADSKSLNKTIDIFLQSEKCKLFLIGAVYLKKDSKLNLKINVNHKSGKNKAYVEVKTVLLDNSEFNFEGLININKKSHLVDSYLKQNNLLASDFAICNTSPQLCIGADNVKASHGATVSGFNQDEIFYLQSRGYSLMQAQKLLSESFLLSVYSKKSEMILKKLKISSITNI